MHPRKRGCPPSTLREFITKCEAAGINTWQLDHTEQAVGMVRKLREHGSKRQFICLHYESRDVPLNTAAADLGHRDELGESVTFTRKYGVV